MNKKIEADVIDTMNALKAEFLEKFSFITDYDELPKRKGIEAYTPIMKVSLKPDTAFQLLELFIGQPYIDIFEKKGTIFVDDKVNWDFYFRSSNGFINVHDWKSYSVKICSVGAYDNAQDDVKLLNDLLEKGGKIYVEYMKAHSKEALENAPLDNFIYAMGSLYLLYNHSRKLNEDGSSSYLESLMLLVSIIDTQLRYLILLTRINTRKTRKVDPDFPQLFRQRNGEEAITEREVLKLAKKEIDFTAVRKTELFKKIGRLYDYRNRAVHRFAITSFQYSDIKPVVEEYEYIPEILGDIIAKLEKEQASLGVGFIDKDHLAPLSGEELEDMVQFLASSKIDPVGAKKAPRRMSMFSDRYKGGINPRLKKLLDENFKKKTEQS